MGTTDAPTDATRPGTWLGSGAPPARHGDRRRTPRQLVPVGPGPQEALPPPASVGWTAEDAGALERARQRLGELEREVAQLRARLERAEGERRLTIRERITGRRRPSRGRP